jgi:hypothetical protein
MDSAIAAPSRWRTYLKLGRVSNLPTVWTNVIAGIVLAGFTPSGSSFLATLIGVSLVYTGGMFLNDAFDRNFDRQFKKNRPIPAGDIESSEVFLVGFGLIAVAEGLFVFNLWSTAGVSHLAAGLILAAVVIYYDYRHKGDPLSPLIMALCRFMVYLVAATLVVSTLPPRVWFGGGVLVAYLIGLTYIAKQENLGAVRNLWPLAFLLAPLFYTVGVLRHLGTFSVGSLAYVLLASATIYALSLLRKGRFNVPRAVVTLIAGISLVDAVLIASAGGPSVWIGCGLAGFAATILLQRAVSGT